MLMYYTLADTSLSKLPHHINGRMLSHNRFIVASIPIRVVSSVALELKLMTRHPRAPDANHKTTVFTVSRPSSFHTLSKLIWCGSWVCNLGQSLSNHGPHVFYRRRIRRASRKGKQFNLITDEEPVYMAEIWLWPSPEDKEGQLAPTPRRCNAGCLMYRQCALEECDSDIQYQPIP
ncbi:uncharacterized protein TNCV_970941 [Trichonephila clavipes]|nr:uncharacterized protein TNCV_970941 [Trichonephila clavipes]